MYYVNKYEDFPLICKRNLTVNTENFGLMPDCDNIESSIDVKFLTINYSDNAIESIYTFLSLFTKRLKGLTIISNSPLNISLSLLTEKFPYINKIKIITTKVSVFSIDTDIFGKMLLTEDESYNNAYLSINGPVYVDMEYIIEIMYAKFKGCIFPYNFSVTAPRMKLINCIFPNRQFAFLYINNYRLKWLNKPPVFVLINTNINKLFIYYLSNYTLKVVTDCANVRISCCGPIEYVNCCNSIGTFDLTMCDNYITINDGRDMILSDYIFFPGSKIMIKNGSNIDFNCIRGCFYKNI